MRTVKYGAKVIEYSVLEREGLKSHYITVDSNLGVVLKGRQITPEAAEKLIVKKARWILNKLSLIKSNRQEDLVTGSRIQYLGKSYYVEIIDNPQVKKVKVCFTYSRFVIQTNSKKFNQTEIKLAVEEFYKKQGIKKITPRVEKLAKMTGLKYSSLRFQKMKKRWGSCTEKDKIIINTHAIKLPYSLIDYLIIHELCHTKVKDHSRSFYRELSRHTANWKEHEERLVSF